MVKREIKYECLGNECTESVNISFPTMFASMEDAIEGFWRHFLAVSLLIINLPILIRLSSSLLIKLVPSI